MAQQADLTVTVALEKGQAEAMLADLQKKLGVAAKKASETGSIFDRDLSDVIRRSLGAVETKFDAATGGMVRFSTITGGLKLAAGGAAAGVTALGGAMAYGVHEMMQAEEAQKRLRSELAAQGAATPSNIAALNAYAESIGQTTRFADDLVTSAQAMGLQLGVPVSKLKEFGQAAADLAAAKDIGIEDAARLLGQTMDGTVGKIGQLLPQLQGLTEAQLRNGDAVKTVAKLYGGAAAADANTLTGSLGMFKNSLSDAAKLLATSTTGTDDLAVAVRAARDFVVEMNPAIRDLGTYLGGVARGAIDAKREVQFLATALADEGILKLLFGGGNQALGAGESAFENTKMKGLEAIQDQAGLVKNELREIESQLASVRDAREETFSTRGGGAFSLRAMGAGESKKELSLPTAVRGLPQEQQIHELLKMREGLEAQLQTLTTAEAAEQESLAKLSAAERAATESTAALDGTFHGLAKGLSDTEKATAKTLGEMRDWMASAPAVAAALNEINLPAGEHLTLLAQLESEGDALRKKLAELWSSGQIKSVESYAENVGGVLSALDSVEQAAERVRAQQLQGFGDALATTGSDAEARALLERRALAEKAASGGGAAARQELAMRDLVSQELNRQNELIRKGIAITGDRAVAERLLAQEQLRRRAASGEDDDAARQVELLDAELAMRREIANAADALTLKVQDRAAAEAMVAEQILRQKADAGDTDAQEQIHAIEQEASARAANNDEIIRLIGLTGDLALAQEMAAQAALERAAQSGTGDAQTQAQETLALEQAKMEAIDARLAREQELVNLGYSQEAASNMVADSLLRQAAAQDTLAGAQARAELAAKRQQGEFNKQVALMRVGMQAAGQLASSLMGMAISGEGSVKKMVVATLTSLATESAAKVFFEIAEAYAATARYDPVSAASHTAAAGFYAKVAVVAGAGAAAINIASGDYGGKKKDKDGVPGEGYDYGRDRAPRDSPGSDTYRSFRESEPAPRANNYQIAITGTLLGGHPQDIARQIQSYLTQFQQETGGRVPPVRG